MQLCVQHLTEASPELKSNIGLAQELGEMEAEHKVIPGVIILPWKTRTLVSLMGSRGKN